MAVNYNSQYFVDEVNKVVGPKVFITPEMSQDKWKGGIILELKESNWKKFLGSIRNIQERIIYPPIAGIATHPETGEDIAWDPSKTHKDYEKWNDLIENFELDEETRKWVKKGKAERKPDVIAEEEKDLAEAKEPVKLRPMRTWGEDFPPVPKFPKGHPMEGKRIYEARGARGATVISPPMVLHDETIKPLTGRQRTLHRQRYGKELSGRLAEGLKTGKFDTVGGEDVARREKLALTDDQSTLFLKKELAKTIEANIAGDKDYYKKADNLDELENIFDVGVQMDPWSGNMTQANIERFISKVENRKPSKQEIYEEQRAELDRRHASRFPSDWMGGGRVNR